MQTWQILDVGSIWMREFAAALTRLEPPGSVVSWLPEMRGLAPLRAQEQSRYVGDPPLHVWQFPLQRGYARAPLRWMLPFAEQMLERLLRKAPEPERSPLVCTTPFYAPVAERWPGPVVYYVTDMTVRYETIDSTQVRALDTRLCRTATAVCPNSKRIADYLLSEAGCDPGKITVVPNATRGSNIPSTPRLHPGELPDDVHDLPRPIAGVLGDLSGNLDWLLLAEAIRRTPDLHWLFVGPTSRAIHEPAQDAARQWVMQHARFVGTKPYGELQRYARCVDVAVLPYMKKEPTYSGSSTRFYEHLAAGRPMIATRGFAELLEKVPLLQLVDTAEELITALDRLRANNFLDGQERARFQASQSATWEQRAQAVRATVTGDSQRFEPHRKSA